MIFKCDWSSDVCSSDLRVIRFALFYSCRPQGRGLMELWDFAARRRDRKSLSRQRIISPLRIPAAFCRWNAVRSEERRVGKSVDLGGRRIIKKKKRRKW